MAAERIHKALKLPGGVKGALRVLELHPLFNPAAYVSADVDPDFVHVRRSPAYEDGSWISLVSPVADLPLQAIVAAVDPHLRAEVSGTESDWTVRVIETDTAAKELPEVAVCKFSGGASWVFEDRKSLPLTVVEVQSDRRLGRRWYSRADPSLQVGAQFVALSRRAAGVDDERLDDPQQVLGQFVDVGVAESEAGPVDVESAHHRVREVQRDLRRHRLGVWARPAGHDEQAEVLVFGQPLERGRDGLRDGLDRIGDATQVRVQPLLKAAGRVHGCRDEQRVGAGEVPVHRLAGDTQRAGDVGDGEVGAAGVDRLARRVEDAAMASSSVAGADPDQPWVRIPGSYSALVGDRQLLDPVEPSGPKPLWF